MKCVIHFLRNVEICGVSQLSEILKIVSPQPNTPSPNTLSDGWRDKIRKLVVLVLSTVLIVLFKFIPVSRVCERY